MCNLQKMKVIHKFKTHRGHPYTVVWQKKITLKGQRCFGQCESPHQEGSLIKLEEGQDDYCLIDTILHEMAHAFFFEQSEKNVTRFTKSTLTLLKKMGLLIRIKENERFRSRSRCH